MTVDNKEFQALLLATEVASPDRDDGPHMRRHYDERRAALVAHLVAHLVAELAAARVAGMLEAAKLAEECMTGLGAAGQIRARAAQATDVHVAPQVDVPAAHPASSKFCYCTGGPNNHQSGCTEGHPSDLPDYEPAAPTATVASAPNERHLWRCPDSECGWEWVGPMQGGAAPLCSHSDCAREMEIVAPAEQMPHAAAPLRDILDDNDRESIVSAIQKLDELATGTIAALGSDNLLKNGGRKKATMADVKRILPYIVGNLRAVVLKLDGGVA